MKGLGKKRGSGASEGQEERVNKIAQKTENRNVRSRLRKIERGTRTDNGEQRNRRQRNTKIRQCMHRDTYAE